MIKCKKCILANNIVSLTEVITRATKQIELEMGLSPELSESLVLLKQMAEDYIKLTVCENF